MPLNPVSLQSALESLFSEPPPTRAECAQAWADAMGNYAAGIIPASTTVGAASAAMVASLTAAFESPAAAPLVDAAFMVFAVSVAGGMVPTFAGVPPPGPLGIADQLLVTADTHGAGADAFAALIHGWMTTGSAALIAAPFTVQLWG
jgi:hypothetical protein